MRILVTSIVDLPRAFSNRPHQLLKRLAKKHHLTLILTLNDRLRAGKPETGDYHQEFQELFQGSEVFYTSQGQNPLLQEVFSFRTLPPLLKMLDYPGFDVHFSYCTLLAGWVAARKLRRAGVATVYDIADDLADMVGGYPRIPTPLRPLARRLGKALVRGDMALAQKVTYTTPILKDTYRIPQEKGVYIPNGVDTELFRLYPPHPLREELGIKAEDFVLGYVGALREWVNLEVVFRTLQRLAGKYPNLKLLIVGNGAVMENQRHARSLGVADRVLFTGSVSYSQVPRYIGAMDVCFIPMKGGGVTQHALPLKLFEYMACGKPVIASRSQGIFNAVADRVLYADTEEEWEVGVRQLYHSQELRQKLGEEGRQMVEDHYQWDKLASQLEEVLLSVQRKR